MKIRLLADYRGILSEERYFTAGEYEAPDQMPLEMAEALVINGRAELIEGLVANVPIQPEPEPKPAPKPRSRTKRGGRTTTS